MRTSRESILGPLFRWADRCPDKLLFSFLDIDGRTAASYTYSQFIGRITDIAVHIRGNLRAAPGDRVLLAYPPGLEVICAFFACVRLGLVPVPVYPPAGHGFRTSLDRMNFIARDCGAAAVLTDRTYYWSIKVNQTRERIATFNFGRDAVSRLPWIVTTDADDGQSGDFPDVQADLLFLQYTSGSTSDPKGVMVSHRNILDNCDAVVDHLPVGVSWLPQYHDMGLIGYYIFFALKGGTTFGFSPLDFIRRPALWLETISKVRGTASSAPNFAFEYCQRPGKLPPETFEGLDLSSLRFLMTAAEPVRAGVFRDFAARFEPYGLDPRSLFAAYGLAEFTLAVANYGRRFLRIDREELARGAVKIAEPGSDAVTLVSCGRPLGSTEVKIVGGAEIPDGQVGEIWLRGASKCQGYWNRPELTRTVFEAELPGQPGTWLRTGDLGFLNGGELFICGRKKDVIIVRGQNYHPQDIELLVEADPRVRKGGVAAFGHDDDGREKVVVVAELADPKALPDSREVNSRVIRNLGLAVDAFVFIHARSIPKTSSGKIQRHLARRRFLEGKLEIVSQVAAGGALEPALSAGLCETSEPPGRRELGGFAAALAQLGLTGSEPWTLGESGLDSLGLVEFSQALQAQLAALGYGELADEADVGALQNIAISELTDLLADLAAANPLAQVRFKRALGDLRQEHRRATIEMMKRDSRLRFEPGHLPRVAGATPPGILLTGGTGFFGPFLLASLLRQTDEDILVLVRAGDDEHGKRRLVEGLADCLEGPLPAGWEGRIRPVCGDLAKVNLGLGTERWTDLAESLGTIVHNGAVVHYLFDYPRMRDANVGGTQEVVRLAMSHRPKALNHISTTFVFGWSVKETLLESDTNVDLDLLDFGYSQSKWVSERVVQDAMRRGLAARIFRPALIAPSVGGAGHNFDISIRLLAFMLNNRLGTTAQNQVSFSPADLAADNIVAISRIPESVGGTFHVTRDEYASMSDVLAIFGELTGQKFTNYPLQEFVPQVISRCGPDDLLFPLLEFFVRSIEKITAMEFKRYDNTEYRRFRDASPHGRADPPLADVVQGILRYMRRKAIVSV
ncbi:MAG: thioester reductase domain-containing protein [Candidatus Sericytochromatia bacterium]|uniref:Thioester reductase domain-containing protein n=1 Tax=Candidatus Tanganyikabacteria bacterium TaxID=2961651 RepID=A0A937X4U5_9BACT|nr:thioester reductase domain-containing protein [Candidatus Tanganyikabacteria bacterium]